MVFEMLFAVCVSVCGLLPTCETNTKILITVKWSHILDVFETFQNDKSQYGCHFLIFDFWPGLFSLWCTGFWVFPDRKCLGTFICCKALTNIVYPTGLKGSLTLTQARSKSTIFDAPSITRPSISTFPASLKLMRSEPKFIMKRKRRDILSRRPLEKLHFIVCSIFRSSPFSPLSLLLEPGCFEEPI